MDEQDRGSYDPLNQPAGTPDTDYASSARQAGNYAQRPAPGPMVPAENTSSHRRSLLISAIALAALALIAGSTYWWILRHRSTALPARQSNQQTYQSQQKAAAGTISTATKNYSSPNFNLSFDYPKDWTVTDSGNGVMTVKSPPIQLTSAAGQKVNGTIELTVRDHNQKLSEFNAGNATAVRDSVKIAYTNPTSTQRANTYISFLQYATTRTLGGMDGVYITADNGYQKGQAIPLIDVQKVDPVISVTFMDANGKPMSVGNVMWDDVNFSGPLTKMLQSFSIT